MDVCSINRKNIQVLHVFCVVFFHYYFFKPRPTIWTSASLCLSPQGLGGTLNVIFLSCCCRLQVILVSCRNTVKGFSQNCHVKKVSYSPGQWSESPSSSETRKVPPLLFWLALFLVGCVLKHTVIAPLWCHQDHWDPVHSSSQVLAPPSKTTFQLLLCFMSFKTCGWSFQRSSWNWNFLQEAANSGLTSVVSWRSLFFFWDEK